MRISDWSSDVCSSDLAAVTVLLTVELRWPLALSLYCYLAVLAVSGWVQLWLRRPDRERSWMHWAFPLIDMTEIGRASCRERVCQYRVDLGGRRILKKKNKIIDKITLQLKKKQ